MSLHLKTSLYFYLIFFNNGHMLFAAENYPYAHASDIQITSKENFYNDNQRSAYLIKGTDIDGEAIIFKAPTLIGARSLIDREIFNVKSTFKSMTAPYSGQITSVVVCDAQKYIKEKKTSFKGSKEAKYIMAVASGRRIFGSCQLEDIQYAAVLWGGYDESRKQVLIIKLFKAITDHNKIKKFQQSILKFLDKIIYQ